MPLLVPLAALERGPVRLSGELDPEEAGLETLDPCIEARRPLVYDVTAQKMGPEVFVEGLLETVFDCRCVRCLEPCEYRMELSPWSCLIPLEGEDAPELVHESVDLTPQIREDSLLALPQHPLCRPDCQGLPARPSESEPREASSSGETGRDASAWSILDRLKLD